MKDNDCLMLDGYLMPRRKGLSRLVYQTPSPGKKYIPHTLYKRKDKLAYKVDQYAAYYKIIETEQCQKKQETLIDAKD